MGHGGKGTESRVGVESGISVRLEAVTSSRIPHPGSSAGCASALYSSEETQSAQSAPGPSLAMCLHGTRAALWEWTDGREGRRKSTRGSTGQRAQEGREGLGATSPPFLCPPLTPGALHGFGRRGGGQQLEGGSLHLILLQVGEAVHLLQVGVQRPEVLSEHPRTRHQDPPQVGLRQLLPLVERH